MELISINLIMVLNALTIIICIQTSRVNIQSGQCVMRHRITVLFPLKDITIFPNLL